MIQKISEIFLISTIAILSCQPFSFSDSSSVRDLRSANLGEEYNNSIFENLPSESPGVSPAIGQERVASMYYSREAAEVALESERAIDNKIITRLEVAIENYHRYKTALTSRRIQFLRDSLRINSSDSREIKLFVMMPNLVREFPDKLHDFSVIFGPDCKMVVLVGTDFEELKIKQLLSGFSPSIEIIPMHSDDAITLGATGADVKEVTLIGIPKDDTFSDRLQEQLRNEAIAVRKRILPPNAPIFDLIGKNGQFAIILRVAWYAAISF